jgi:tetratricopeptide (TPR) repeat protein
MARKILSCSGCNARFDVSKHAPGARFRCGRCNQVLTVPADDGSAAPPPSPAADAPGTAPVAQPGVTRANLTQSTSRPIPSAARPVSAPVRPTGTVSRPVAAAGAAPVVQPGGAVSGSRPLATQAAPPKPAAPVVAPVVTPPPQRPAAPPPPSGGTPEDPIVGQVLHNQYRIVRKLGEGGYGAVYEAKDVHLERRVAIKIMLQARAQSREYVAKFLREARTAAQLTHPNVVAVHGVGFDRDLGVHFLAMEFVEGRTLHDILQERGPLPAEEACNFIIQSCRGLQAAHERNIIHRDIKPGNLMLTPGGVVKITDFGLAKVYDEAAAQSTVIGTPYFMPPEQFEGKAKDGRTDIYALGVTFYYMLTMQRPHTGAGPAQILLSVMTKEPASILEHRPDLPPGLWPIVRRMIHRDVEKRYATCSEIISDLERLLGGGAEEVEQIYCPACGAGNAIDASKCTACGESLQETCPVCGATDAAGTKFCGDCGSNIPLERAVQALLDEAQSFIQSGRIARAKEKLQQAEERSPQNMRIAQLTHELEVRREQRDSHRDAVRELLAHGRPQEAQDRWNAAKAEFPESKEISDLEGDIRSALAARETPGAGADEALANARALEAEGRIREALVAWRGVFVLQPGNDEASEGERRTSERVERADRLAAEAAEHRQQGDPELARERLAEASALLPKDPVISGRLREAERSANELRTELQAAEAALAAGSSEEALDRLRGLAVRHPGNARIQRALDRAEHAGRQATVGAARDRLQKLLQSAKRQESERHLRDAAASYREATTLDRDCAEAQEGLARVQRDLAEVDALLGQSRSLLSSGDPEGAVTAAEQATARHAGDPAAAAQLARARTSLQTLQHEADRIRAALKDEPDDDVLNWARELAGRFPGSTLGSEVLRETEQACRHAEEKAAESRVQMLLQRARKLEEEKQFERAAAAYEEAIRASPGNADVRKSLTVLRERLETAERRTAEAQSRLDAGDPDSAKALAEEALQLIPDQIRTASVLAGANTALTEIDRAVAAFESSASITVERAEGQVERVKRLQAKYPGSQKCIALAERAATVLDEARTAARKQRLQSRIADAEQALAEGRLTDAENACSDALALEPSDPVVAEFLSKIADRRTQAAEALSRARATRESGRLAEAAQLFAKAIELDPSLQEAAKARDAVLAELDRLREHVRKAQNEAVQSERAGRRRAALEAWERAADLDPSHTTAAVEVARLKAWLARAEQVLASAREKLDGGDPDAAIEIVQAARNDLGAWEEGDDLLRRAKALLDEIEKSTRQIERDLSATEGDLSGVAAAARELAGRFPRSARARDAATRAATVAEERRRALQVAQVRKLVRDHRYADAIALSSQIRAQGIASPDLDTAEAQARRVLDEVERFRTQAKTQRARGDLDGARASLAQVQSLLADDVDARNDLHEIDETIREYKVRIDTADAARRRGELTHAVEACREALGLNPGAPDLSDRIADLEDLRLRRGDLVRQCEGAIRGGDGESCVRTAKELLTLFPDDDDARALQTTGESIRNLIASLLAHAKHQRSLGEHDSARATIECLLRVAPDHAEARALLQR